MSKVSVEKILKNGSSKQRALLLCNNIADLNTVGKGFLTDKEVNGIMDSFKSAQEIATYNRYRKIYDHVQNYLTYLSQFRLGYMEALGRLDKFILLRKNNTDMEDLINNILDLIPDKKTRSKVIKVAENFSNIALFRSISADKEGYVEIPLVLLDESISSLQERVRNEQILLKTAIAVIKDYLNETGFNIKVFSAYVRDTENWAKSKKGKDLTFLLSNQPKMTKSQRLQKLFEKNMLELPYESVEIDQEKYRIFRREYLNA